MENHTSTKEIQNSAGNWMRENRIGMGIWQLEQHLFIASTFIFPLKWLCSLDLAFYFWLICYFYERRFMDKLFTWLISFIWLRIFCSFHKKSKILKLLKIFFSSIIELSVLFDCHISSAFVILKTLKNKIWFRMKLNLL